MKLEFKASKNGGFERKWSVLLEHVANSTTLINHHFPGKPFIPVIGDQDNIFYYNVPPDVQIQSKVYQDYYVWWKSAAANQTSFTEGGYYKKDLTQRLSVIVLNSLYWNE